MDLIEFYRSVLTFAGFHVTSDDCLSTQDVNGNHRPFTMSGKRLVLPSREHMADSDWSKRVAFHPGWEEVSCGESEVLTRFRKAMNIRFNQVIGAQVKLLLELAASPAEQTKLSTPQQVFLSKASAADEKTIQAFKSIMSKIPATKEDELFVKIYLKRSGHIGEQVFARAGIVSFPFYTALKAAKGEFHGVKISNKARDTLLGVLEYLFPDLEHPENYYAGSDSKFAPYFESLLLLGRNLAKEINAQCELFGDGIPGMNALKFDMAWVPTAEDMKILLNQIRMIPMLPGNEGAPAFNKIKQAAKEVEDRPVVTRQQRAEPTAAEIGMAVPEPRGRVEPVTPAKTAKGGADFADFAARHLARQQPQYQQQRYERDPYNDPYQNEQAAQPWLGRGQVLRRAPPSAGRATLSNGGQTAGRGVGRPDPYGRGRRGPGF
jgi:hypothetical protein